MRVEDFDYELPKKLIAQHPLRERSDSRLLVVDRSTGVIEHRSFRDILDYIRTGDALILNDTRVIPARLIGVKQGTGARIEMLLLRQTEPTVWEVLAKPGKRLKPGNVVSFGDGLLVGEVLGETMAGGKHVRFSFEGIFDELLDQLGTMPLPPYIETTLGDQERYQTVFARERGSAAAPTAGLHFTETLLASLANQGVDIGYITLHVGLGTFRPVQVDTVEEHVMHSEYYRICPETAALIRAAKVRGGRIVAVGTTVARTLEAVAREGNVAAREGWTDIFLYPGCTFQMVDALLTNFHLPRSTLLMLASAFATKECIMEAYKEAIEREYRFFSFGDAMFIL